MSYVIIKLIKDTQFETFSCLLLILNLFRFHDQDLHPKNLIVQVFII